MCQNKRSHRRMPDPTPVVRDTARSLARELTVIRPELRTRLVLLRSMHGALVEKRDQAVSWRNLEAAGRHGRQVRAVALVIHDVVAAMRAQGIRPVHTAPHPAIA